MKLYLAFLMALCFGVQTQARIHQYWSVDALNDNATLIVVATPSSVTATTERTNLLSNVRVTGVETSFDILAVLKGDRSIKTLVLHHYALVPKQNISGGPNLVAFDPKERKQYLIFLQKEADGRYVAVSGQIDPDGSFMEFAERLPDPKNFREF
jgi:hypothetical protein